MLSRDWGKLQMPKTGKESIFDPPWHHQWLKNTTPGQRKIKVITTGKPIAQGTVQVFEKQVR
jgi:hypothetical protein